MNHILKVSNMKSLLTNLVFKNKFSISAVCNSNIFTVQDEADFTSRVLNSKKPVIVDFHAVWCGPCRILGPRLEKLLATYEGKIDFAKVDIDQLSDLAFKYNVNSVPTVIAVKNGKEVGKFVGLIDDDRIRKFVKDAMDN